MRDWKMFLAGGLALIVVGCSEPIAPPLSAKAKAANVLEPCESRSGYFVRAGREYSDDQCEVPL